MREATVGQLLINDALPDDVRDDRRVLDKKGLAALLRDVAHKHSDKYRDVVRTLNELGADFATTTGVSFSIKDFLPSAAKQRIAADVRAFVSRIAQKPGLTEAQRNKEIVNYLASRMDEMRGSTFDESVRDNNHFAEAIVSGARGNKANLSSLRGADLMVLDHKDRPIPVPIVHNYSEGLSPAEYFASSYGTRKGVISTKMATAQAGYLTKLLTNAAGNLVVSDESPAPGTGTPVETDDPDNIGAVLARDYGEFPAGTVITPSILKALAKLDDEILVHSPISSGGAGVPRLAAGVRERGRMASVGENVGLAAAQAVGEPISQAQLCLARGTLVRMANGTTKRIESIRAGMVVLGADTSGCLFPVRVVRTYDNGHRPCIESTFRPMDGSPKQTLKSTTDHKIVTRFRAGDAASCLMPVGAAPSAVYVIAADVVEKPRASIAQKVVAALRSVFFWLTPPAARVARAACATFIEYRDIGLQQTYDIEVDHPDHLYVLANGMVVSNSSKHAAGVVGATRGASVSGFDAVNQLVQIPKTFRNAAAIARLDGAVTRIAPAPHGGHYVWLGEEQHYVFPESDVSVNVGDVVSAGDALSSGVPNPADIVRYKGIGEGRRYFVQQLRKTLMDNDIPSHRRNIELLARGLINHVRIVEPDGIEDALPDDIMPYDEVVRRYKPRFGYVTLPPGRARGKYLERPTLHYSIGTRITQPVTDTLKRHRVNAIDVHDDPPPFEPHMVRALELAVHDPDFFRRLSGFYIGKGFMNAVQRGGSSQIHSVNWPHALAHGVDFGKELTTKGVY